MTKLTDDKTNLYKTLLRLLSLYYLVIPYLKWSTKIYHETFQINLEFVDLKLKKYTLKFRLIINLNSNNEWKQNLSFLYLILFLSWSLIPGLDESASATWIEKYYVFEVTVKGYIYIYIPWTDV